ncbi:MAG: hypothetical protein ACPG7F_12205 [Aggregatilineales bacterium]
MTSVRELRANMDAALLPEAKRDAALALLDVTSSRQHLDMALLTLASEQVICLLDDKHRAVLREKALFYFNEPPAKDKAGMLREKLTRLLVHIGNPADKDVYLAGVKTYYKQPATDVAQNLRAAALAGLATCDRETACLYATKFLGEDDMSVFNCEPAVTAIEVLARFNQILPIYGFINMRGTHFAGTKRGEAVAKAFEALPDDFPVNLFEAATTAFIEMDAPVVCTGILEAILVRREADLYGVIDDIINHTADMDLHRYAVIATAAARDDRLTDMLYRRARMSPREMLHNFIEALELTYHPERDDTLKMLQKRL